MHKLGYGPKKSKPTKSIEKGPEGASEEKEVANEGLSYDEPDLLKAPSQRKHNDYGKVSVPCGDIMMSKRSSNSALPKCLRNRRSKICPTIFWLFLTISGAKM
jgi:hypothetical protein